MQVLSAVQWLFLNVISLCAPFLLPYTQYRIEYNTVGVYPLIRCRFFVNWIQLCTCSSFSISRSIVCLSLFSCYHAHGTQSKFTNKKKNIYLVSESLTHSWTPQFYHRFWNAVTQTKWLLFFVCVCIFFCCCCHCQMLLSVFHLNFILIVVCPFWHFTLT